MKTFSILLLGLLQWHAPVSPLHAEPSPPRSATQQKELADAVATEAWRYIISLPNCKYTFREIQQGLSNSNIPQRESLIEFCKYDNKFYHKRHCLTDNTKIVVAYDGENYVHASGGVYGPSGFSWTVRTAKDYSKISRYCRGNFYVNPVYAPLSNFAPGLEDGLRFHNLVYLTDKNYWLDIVSRWKVETSGPHPSIVYSFSRTEITPEDSFKVKSGWTRYVMRSRPGSVIPEYIHCASQLTLKSGESPPKSARERKVTKWFLSPKDARGAQIRMPSVYVEGIIGQAESRELLPTGIRSALLEDTFTLLDAPPPPGAFSVPMSEVTRLWDLDLNLEQRWK